MHLFVIFRLQNKNEKWRMVVSRHSSYQLLPNKNCIYVQIHYPADNMELINKRLNVNINEFRFDVLKFVFVCANCGPLEQRG